MGINLTNHEALPIQSPADFLIKWTPRVVVITVASYYSLGFAYASGIMAVIDQIAIAVIKNVMGYAGVGALMPSVQWYSAWAVRIIFGVAAGISYDLAERAAKALYSKIDCCSQQGATS